MSGAADVLVIGGGPAGAAAAARLAAGGLGVVLCERQGAPRPQVCGEFLSGAAAAELAALGLDPAGLGARPITRVRLTSGTAAVAAGFATSGYGISRTRLDQHLLGHAARAGVGVRTGVGVRALERAGGLWSATLGDGSRIESAAVVLATGKHDLRGHPRPPGGSARMIGFKMHFRLRADQAAALEGAVELFPYEGGYAGLQLIEGGTANLCFVVGPEHLRGGGHAWPAALAHLFDRVPVLRERLRDARPLYPRPASVAHVPYGYLCRPEAAIDGIYRVGDQAAVIPSLAGEGIAIALRSARLAAGAIAAGHGARRYTNALRREVIGPLRRAGVVDAALRRRPLRRHAAAIAAVPGVLPALARLTRLGLGAGG